MSGTTSSPYESILSIPGPVPLIIDNKPVITPNTYTVLNPNDPESLPLHDVSAANVTETRLAIESAQKAFMSECLLLGAERLTNESMTI